MQTASYKKSTAKTLVDGLIGVGYSKEKAINLYNKYKYWNKLEYLAEYISEKEKKLGKRTGVTFNGME